MDKNHAFLAVQIFGVFLIAAGFVAVMALLAYLILMWYFNPSVQGLGQPDIFYWLIQ